MIFLKQSHNTCRWLLAVMLCLLAGVTLAHSVSESDKGFLQRGGWRADHAISVSRG